MYLPRWQCHLPQCHLLIKSAWQNKKVPFSSADTYSAPLQTIPVTRVFESFPKNVYSVRVVKKRAVPNFSPNEGRCWWDAGLVIKILQRLELDGAAEREQWQKFQLESADKSVAKHCGASGAPWNPRVPTCQREETTYTSVWREFHNGDMVAPFG